MSILDTSNKVINVQRDVQPVIVLKLGGSVLDADNAVEEAALEIKRFRDAGYRVVAVVSAIAGTTDHLVERGRSFSENSKHLPYLLSTGECASAALLALALEQIEVETSIKLPHQIGLRASGEPNDATIYGINKPNLLLNIRRFESIIVPGFYAENAIGDQVLLGRGGTDLTAVYLGSTIENARIRLIKDVDGVYEADPKNDPNARRFEKVSYEDAFNCATPLIQPKTIEFARDFRVEVEIAGLSKSYNTLLCRETALAPAFQRSIRSEERIFA